MALFGPKFISPQHHKLIRIAHCDWCSRSRAHERQLESFAIQLDSRNLAHNALASWRARYANKVVVASTAADATRDSIISSRAFRLWALARRRREFVRSVLDPSVRYSFWSKWRDKFDHVRFELSDDSPRVRRAVARVDLNLVDATFRIWRESTKRVASDLVAIAASFDRGAVVARSLRRWRDRLGSVGELEQTANVVGEFFDKRRGWNAWTDQLRERERARWFDERIAKRKLEALQCQLSFSSFLFGFHGSRGTCR